MNAVYFEDKVCNAFNYIDMHSVEIGREVTFRESADMISQSAFPGIDSQGESAHHRGREKCLCKPGRVGGHPRSVPVWQWVKPWARWRRCGTLSGHRAAALWGHLHMK